MRRIIFFIGLLIVGISGRAQHVLKLNSDTVKIGNDSSGTGELIVNNSTSGNKGVLFNKGSGVTEFRALKFIRVGDSTLVIFGTDTTSIVAGSGPAGSVYYGDPDVVLSVAAQDETHMQLRWWKTEGDLYQNARVGIIGDSQGEGVYASSYSNSIFGRLQTFMYSVCNNIAVTNYSKSGYNSRQMAPTGSNAYVDNERNITKALADGNKIIILCNTSNDFYSGAAGGVTTIEESMANTLLIADACAKAGATLFVVSSFPRNSLSVEQRDQLKTMAGLLNQKFGARCAYVYHLIEDPAHPNELNPAWQVGDNIHLNDVGCNVLYAAIRDMLTSYYTSNTMVARYQLQKTSLYNGTFSDDQYYTQPNDPSATLPADSNYYRVRLEYNNGYYSKWSNVVQGTLGDQETINSKPPLVAANQPQLILLPANTVSLTASASSPNSGGSIVSYTWIRVSGNPVTFTSPNTASTTVNGLVEGNYVFRCKATDNEGRSSFADAVVMVQIPDENNTAAKFNFNYTPESVNGWVDVSGSPVSSSIFNKSWTDNLHNITLANISTAAWGQNYYDNSANANGSSVPDMGGYSIPQSVVTSGWYCYNLSYTGPSSDQLKITGLDPAKFYKIRILSSLASSFGLDANPTVVVVKDKPVNQKQVNAVGNTSNMIVFRGISPTPQGEIPLFVGVEAGLSNFGMINGMTVQEDTHDGPLTAPTVTSEGDRNIQLPVSVTVLSVTAVDVDGALDSAVWTQVSGPTGAIIADPSKLKTNVTNLSAGTYVFRCTVTDNDGQSAHADVQVVVEAASTNPMLHIGVTKTLYVETGWDVMVGEPNKAVVPLTADLGSTTVNISTVSTANWTPYLGQYTADQTGEYNDDGGGLIAPLNVQKGCFFNVNTYDVAKPQIQLTNLPAGTYKVTMLGSILASFGLNAHTDFRVNGGTAVTVDASGNTSHLAIFNNVTVGVDGTMKLYFNPSAGATVGMLSYFIIEKTN